MLGGPRLPAQLMDSFLPWRQTPTVVMGLARGTRPQDLAEKRSPRPQKMQGEMPRNFLKVTWNRHCQESGAKALTLKTSFSPKEYMGTREALGGWGDKREEGWSGQQL